MILSLPLILASASPRRAALLAQMGLSFRTLVSGIEEPPPATGEEIMDWAQRAALEKARAAAALLTSPEPALILGADTVVVLSEVSDASAPLLHGCPARILGKPGTPDIARVMLAQLSGTSHIVVSAFALLTHPAGEAVTDVVETRVQFRHLSEEEVTWYISSGEPLDKAGAYGIQGLGAVLVEGITGDYYTVVGLPLARLWQRLQPWQSV